MTDQNMRLETTSEHVARDMREGAFPGRSEPQMVPVEPTNQNTAPLDLDRLERRSGTLSAATDLFEEIAAFMDEVIKRTYPDYDTARGTPAFEALQCKHVQALRIRNDYRSSARENREDAASFEALISQAREAERMRGALEAILKVEVYGHDNIWAGSHRCKDIARQALAPATGGGDADDADLGSHYAFCQEPAK